MVGVEDAGSFVTVDVRLVVESVLVAVWPGISEAAETSCGSVLLRFTVELPLIEGSQAWE